MTLSFTEFADEFPEFEGDGPGLRLCWTAFRSAVWSIPDERRLKGELFVDDEALVGRDLVGDDRDWIGRSSFSLTGSSPFPVFAGVASDSFSELSFSCTRAANVDKLRV